MHKEPQKAKRNIGGVFDCRDDDGFTLLHGDDNLYSFLGYTAQQFKTEKNNRMMDVIYQEDRKELNQELHASNEEKIYMLENRLSCRDGSIKWVWISVQRHKNTKGPYFHCIFHDITAEKKMQDTLKISEKRLEFLLDQTQDIVFEYDFINKKIAYSDNFTKKFGYAIPSRKLPEAFFEAGLIFKDDKVIVLHAFQSLLKAEEDVVFEIRIRYRKQGYRWIKVYVQGLWGEHNQLIDILGVISDIHDQKEEVLESCRKAAIDPLTGLYNRRECIRRLDDYIALHDDLMAFILLDLDDFKSINDSFGHHQGDETLKLVSRALVHLFREQDVVARIGGDEFVICLLHLSDKEIVTHKVESIQNMFAMELQEALGFSISCSIGVSFYPKQGDDFNSLLEMADVAMYQAKKAGKNRFVFQESQQAQRKLSPELYMKKTFRDRIVNYIFRILSNSDDNQMAIEQLLELVGTVFHGDRATVYECQEGVFKLLFQWESNERYHLQNQSFLDIGHIVHSHYYHDGTLLFRNINEVKDDDLTTFFKQRLALAGIVFVQHLSQTRDLLICFEDCQRYREKSGESRYTMTMIANVICILLKKERYYSARRKADFNQINFVMNHIPGGLIAAYQKEGLPLYNINETMLHMLGYTSQSEYASATGGYSVNSIYVQDRSKLREIVRKQLKNANDSYACECRMVKKNGEIVWMMMHGRRMKTSDGNDIIISLYNDITQQKDYENQFEIYRVASNAGTFINCPAKECTLLYANDLFYEILETTPEQMQKEGNDCMRLVHPDDEAMVCGNIEEALQKKAKSLQWEMRIITPKKKTKWVVMSGILEKNEQGVTLMKGVIQDTSWKHHLQQATEKREQIYRIALHQSHVNVWEYDIKKHTIYLTESGIEHHDMEEVTENVPQSLIDSGMIHPSSQAALKDMYQRIENGDTQVRADILTANPNHDGWWWERITYTTVFDEKHRPISAVAIGEDVTTRKEVQAKYRQDLQLSMGANEGLLLNFRGNLNQNKIEYIEGELPKSKKGVLCYDDLLKIQAKYVASPEDCIRFKNTMKRGALASSYEKGEKLVKCEFRCRDKSGHLYWVQAISRLLKDTFSDELYVFGTLQNIDEKKNMELSLNMTAQHDSLTGVYVRDSGISMIMECLSKLDENAPALMLLFSIDHFYDLVHDTHVFNIDDILAEMGSQLLTHYTRNKIVARLFGDEFVVLFYKDIKGDEVKEYINVICASLRIPYAFDELQADIAISCGGMVIHNSQENNFNALYDQASNALYQARLQQLTYYIIQDNKDDYRYQQQAQTNANMQDNFLCEVLQSMEEEKNTRKALHKAIAILQNFYQADGVLLNDTYGKIKYQVGLQHSVDWFKHHRFLVEMQKQNSKGVYISCIINCDDALKISNVAVYNDLKEAGIKQANIMMVNTSREAFAYLEIDNPNNYANQGTLLEILGIYLKKELDTLHLEEKKYYSDEHDTFTGLKNRFCFQQYCNKQNFDHLIALGVLSIDINGMREINHMYGNDYGDELIRKLSYLLNDVFKGWDVYRFTGDEFLVVAQNCTYEVFTKRNNKFKKKVDSLCSVAMGEAWSNHDIHIQEMLNSADEQRLVSKRLYYNDAQINTQKRQLQRVKEVKDLLADGHFMVYIQKKVDARTGKIVGGEALIRYRDDRYGMMGPETFIPPLEKLGAVHFIDFYVFEQVHEILQTWRKEGHPLVPISLNFSRTTLLENQLVKKMNEIHNKYDIDKSYIEIEITENMGEIERTTIEKQCSALSKAGYPLSLDDFGSKYSNIVFLSTITFSTLKLDKGLIKDIISNRKSRMIISTILELCQRLAIKVVAEGVEYKEQLDVLIELGCPYIQGFYFGKPIPAIEFDTRDFVNVE